MFTAQTINLTRRDFGRKAVACVAGTMLSFGAMPIPAFANTPLVDDFWRKPRRLRLRTKTTGDFFDVVFWRGGHFDQDNYVRLCYLLRDVQTNTTVEHDPELFNLLYGLQEWGRLLGRGNSEIIVNDGYRPRERNASMEAAAPNSEHPKGTAVDMRMHGVTLMELRSMALFFGMGGVGLYPSHLHVDVGRPRQWISPKIASKSNT